MRSCLAGFGMVCTIVFICSATPALAHEDGTHEDLVAMALPLEMQQAYGANWQQPLGPVFDQAADDFKVPVEILMALGQIGSAFENRGGAPTIERGYGIMALRDNTLGGDSLALASQLTNASIEQLKLDPVANIRGAAAVLDQYARDIDVDRKAGLEAWTEVLVRYAALDAETSRMFAAQVYERIERGFSLTNNLGETFTLQGTALSASPNELLRVPEGEASADYGPATWYPAASCNYTAGYYGKNTVVMHTIEGSASGCLSWFRNCNASVSAHYVTSEGGGVWQCVYEDDKAWHVSCANNYCIGIEQEGYAGSSSHPQALYDAGGLLVRDICNSWGIAKTKNSGCSLQGHVVGHIDITNCLCGTHTDPGAGFNWSYFMSVVSGAPPTPSYDATYNNQSYPSSMTAGTTAVVWAEFVNKGTNSWTHCATKLGTSSPNDRTSPFCNLPNWACADGSNQGCNRPTDVDQSSVTTNNVGRFTFILKAPTTPGVYVEKFRLVREGVTWFGPEITWTITVTAANGNLSGTVTNASTSAAIAGATVTLSGIGNATTNGSGVYTFNNVAAGNYTVSVSAASFNPGSSGVTITAGATATKNFALTPTDTQAPTVPQNLAANATGPNTVQLTWDASTDNVGVAGYDIRRNGTVIGSSATNSYTDNTAPADSTLTYDVRAKDAVPNYSAYSNTAQATTPPAPPTTVTIFSDGFNGNLNNWTQQVGGYAYSTTVSRGGVAGGGAAYMAAGETDQMFHTFTRPFAQCKGKAWFYDGKGGWKASVCGWAYRTGMSLRDINNAAGVYLDNEFYNSPDNSKYYFRIIGTGGVSTHTAYATRDANTDCAGTWVGFETEVIPTAVGGTCVLKVTDRSGTQSTTQNLTTDFFSHGIGRFTLGLGVSSTNEGYWDDAIFEANPPIKPDMDAPTVLSDTQIKWNFAAGDNNHFGWDVLNEGGSALSPSWPNAGWLDHAATSWTETGLTPNTVYTRKVKCWNGTLDSAASITQSARTLSATPNASSVTPSQETVCSGADVVWTAVGGFGAGKVEYYHYAWDQSPTHTFDGTEQIWSSGLLVLNAADPGNWYLHLQGFNADDVPNGNYAAMVVATGCDAPTLMSAVSRKTHAAAGVFDLDVSSPAVVESRTGGPTQVLVTFSTAIAGAGGLDNADVAVSSGSISGVSIAGDVLTVSLAGVTDGQKLSITFPGIVSSGSGLAVPAGEAICFGVLSGDVSGDGVSNVFDLVAVRNALNQVPAAGNFRSDVTGDGAINVFDLVAVRNNLNKSVTGTCPGGGL